MSPHNGNMKYAIIKCSAAEGARLDEVPDYVRRYPTRAGREALAAHLGLTINPFSQDWEWEVAKPENFARWLALYRQEPLTDDERFSLMEMLVQCVEELAPVHGPREQVDSLVEWQAVAALLRANPWLHGSTIGYWSVFGQDDPEGQFRVSQSMRRVWADVQQINAEPF